ncbi:hypothetical protein ACFV3F_10160 [Streptomyces sp. NPDC059717]|uniref:hypothetical protein n=1 Tax=Streptomyces sp. NPDC059717 TaxID=3346922 RepID=UPI0036CE08BD
MRPPRSPRTNERGTRAGAHDCASTPAALAKYRFCDGIPTRTATNDRPVRGRPAGIAASRLLRKAVETEHPAVAADPTG